MQEKQAPSRTVRIALEVVLVSMQITLYPFHRSEIFWLSSFHFIQFL